MSKDMLFQAVTHPSTNRARRRSTSEYTRKWYNNQLLSELTWRQYI